MGVDISSLVEFREAGEWKVVEGLDSILYDSVNLNHFILEMVYSDKSKSFAIDKGKGFYLYIDDMINFDYNDPVFPDNGIFYNTHISWRDFLGEDYFRALEELKALGTGDNVRVYCWFSF